MEWLKRNAKTVIGALVILILVESVLAWYLIQQFRDNYLRGDDALQIALEDANVPRDAAQHVDIDLKTKSGTAWYEITFEGDSGTTYRCSVDAETGAVLSMQIQE